MKHTDTRFATDLEAILIKKLPHRLFCQPSRT